MEATNKNLQDAYNLLQSGNYQEAQEILLHLLKQNRNNDKAWYLLGLSLQDSEKKLYAFKQVLRIDPSNQHATKQISRIENGVLVNLNQTSVADSKNAPPKSRKRKTNTVFLWSLALFSVMIFCVGGLGILVLFRNGYFSMNQNVNVPILSFTSTAVALPAIAATSLPSSTPLPIETPTTIPTRTPRPEIPITSLVIPIDMLRSGALSYLNTEMWCNEKDIQSVDYSYPARPNLLLSVTAEQSTGLAWDGTLLGSVPCNDATLREVSLEMYLHKWSKETDMSNGVDIIAAQYPNYSKARLPEIASSTGVQLPPETVMLRDVDGIPDGGAPKTLVFVSYRNNVSIAGVLIYPLMYDDYKIDELLAGYMVIQHEILREAGY